jgi:hypothetical protein
MKAILKTLLVVCVVSLGVVLSACGDDGDTVSQVRELQYTQENQERLTKVVGFPEIRDSLELRNLKRRYEDFNDANKIGYVYLIDYGKIFAEYTVKGKVSSMSSQYTNPRVLSCRKIRREGEDWTPCGDIDQPEPDGSYGNNPNGIFFWTADDIYVEWGGDYMYSSERIEIQQPAENVITKQAP